MKFVTWNIQYSKGRDGRFDLDRTARTLAGADVIALQEVERFWPRSGMLDQPVELARRLPNYHWVYGPAFDVHIDGEHAGGRRCQFGTMLLARRPILASRLHLLPLFATVNIFNLQKGVLEGVVKTLAGPLRIYSLHLTHLSVEERLAHIEELSRITARARTDGGAWSGPIPAAGSNWDFGTILPEPGENFVMMGDFNFTPDDVEYQRATDSSVSWSRQTIYRHRGLVDTWPVAGEGEGATCFSNLAARTPQDVRIDYVFVNGGLASKVKRSWVDREADGSDHQPYWVDIDLD
jgi:endonuclease/exonuclease/phosphatase family metal-dependent hydrolase